MADIGPAELVAGIALVALTAYSPPARASGSSAR